MNVLSFDQQVRIIGALTEGCSIRSTERLTGIHRDTIMRFGLKVGEACHWLHSHMMRDLHVNTLELDEAWAFIQKKQRHVKDGDPSEYGDCYLWIALDANRKAVISYVVGKRTAENAQAFLTDLRARILNRPQVTSDGYAPYIDAVDQAFGGDVDYAMLQKIYQSDGSGDDAAHRYSPGRVIGIEKKIMQGSPDWDKISTCYVERQNLTIRMHMRRFTRLTNGFSKKLENPRAAVSLHIGYYNFCRVHETLRVTPAMEVGVTDHIWNIAELIERAMATPVTPPPTLTPTLPRDPETGLLLGRKPFKLRVIKDGKISSSRGGSGPRNFSGPFGVVSEG